MSQLRQFNIAKNKASAFAVNKFGYNTSVGNSYEPVTDLGTNVLPTTAAAVSIVSASANDASAGTGARTVEIQGLDENYNVQTSTVTLNGTTAVTTGSDLFIRIFRMKVLTAGTGETNAGNLTASIGGSNVAQIAAGNGQTLMAVYTIPAGYRGYLTKFQASLSKNQEAQVQIRIKTATGAWQTKGLFGTFANTIEYKYDIPLEFEEKTDIQFRTKAGATSEMGVVFDLVVAKV